MEDDGGAYDQQDATGFIRLQALPLRVAAKETLSLSSPGLAAYARMFSDGGAGGPNAPPSLPPLSYAFSQSGFQVRYSQSRP